MTAYDNLQYTEQTEDDGSVIFLGAKLQKRSNRLEISLFDKAKEWSFNVLKYPSADSSHNIKAKEYMLENYDDIK